MTVAAQDGEAVPDGDVAVLHQLLTEIRTARRMSPAEAADEHVVALDEAVVEVICLFLLVCHKKNPFVIIIVHP